MSGVKALLLQKAKWKWHWHCRERNLDGVVLEEGVIEGRLVGDMHAVYDVPVRTLLS